MDPNTPEVNRVGQLSQLSSWRLVEGWVMAGKRFGDNWDNCPTLV